MTSQIRDDQVQAQRRGEAPHGYAFKASIIMPAWNKLEFTTQCIQAVAENTPEMYEFIAVDNASVDDTARFLASLEGDVKVISNSENLGFIEACIQGAEAASGEYLVWLNNDTIPQPGWLEALVDYADMHPDVGVVGSKLIYPDGRLQEAGALVFSDATGWNYGKFGDASHGAYNFVRDVDYSSGAVLLIRRTAWDAIGGLDRRFKPAYYEDTDLCFSIRQAGWRVVYQPASVVIHVEGATNGTDTTTGVKRWQAVNHEKFFAKWRETLERDHWPSPPQWLKQAAVRTRKKNILVIDRLLPWFDRASGSLRTFEIVRALRDAGHHVTFVSLGGREQGRYAFTLQQLGVEVYAPGIGGLVDAERTLRELLAALRYDVALLTFWDTAERLTPLIRSLSPATKIVTDSVDLHYLREERGAKLSGDPAFERKAAETRRRELATYATADGVVVVSEDEKAALEADAECAEVVVVGNIHRVRDDVPSLEGRDGLLFVGNFLHPPNADAIRWFCNDVWPLIHERHPEAVLRIAGFKSGEALSGERWDGVAVMGHVANLDAVMAQSRLMVAPLRYGAGVKGKIGEAFCAALPVVTTPTGAEGMGIEDGLHALVAESAADFAEAVARLLEDDALWASLQANGRQLAERTLSVTSVRERVLAVFGGDSRKPRWETPPVSIIMLSWNGLNYTRLCVESVLQSTREPFELIVVENGSKDGSLDYLRSVKGIRLVENPVNRGFAPAVNQGLAVARGDWCVLLNNDTVVTEGWMERLIAHGERDRSVGVIGPMSNHTAGYQLVPSVPYGDDLEAMRTYVAAFAHEYDGQGFAAPRAIGFCMAIRLELIQKIGGLDEIFGNGSYEDDDYSIRAQIAGFRVWIARDVFIHHFGSRSYVDQKVDLAKLMDKNWGVFKRKWGLPASLPYARGIPYEELLSRRFDGRQHVIGLPAAGAAVAKEQTWAA